MTTQAQTLYRLQLLDTDLTQNVSKLREVESQLGESRELLSARAAKEQADADIVRWRARLRELEIDQEVLSSRIKASEQRLYSGQVANPKELTGLQQDVQVSRRSRDKVEDEILMVMERLDGCQDELATTSAQLRQIETSWRKAQDELAQSAGQLKERIAELREARRETAQQVEAKDLALYEELMRKKGGRAVARLVGEMCEGCRVTVPSSTAQQVRRGGELIACANCGRILTP